MEIIVGKTYRFKNEYRSSLKDELKGKVFKVIADTKIEVYNQDGSIVRNGGGMPFFTFHSSSILNHIDFSYGQIEPAKSLKKFSLS